MTDAGLLDKKLAFIETCLRELRALANPSAIETDVKERRFIEHTLQIGVQAAQDVASHIVSDEKLGEPSTNLELFRARERLSRSMIAVEAPGWRGATKAHTAGM